jgi:CMP/dCMP kinase
MVIAIDGPAGAGKSSVARAAAERLGFTYLDSGAMYRAVACRAQSDGADAAEVARTVRLELGDRVRLDGEDVTERIREPWVSEAASRVSSDPAVREALVAQQRRILAEGDWVAEGRDIGTVVAPEAEVKVFLTAAPEERARRRAAELGTDPAVVLREQAMRDERDRSRAHSPLAPALDAVPVDTTGLSLDEVVEQIVTLAVEAKELDVEGGPA